MTKHAFWQGAVRGVGLGNMVGGWLGILFLVSHHKSLWLIVICICAMLGGCLLFLQDKEEVQK
jgi:hypothetical protein